MNTRQPSHPRARRQRPTLEGLERREVLTATFSGGILTVLGTAGNDTIELFGRGPGVVEVIAPGVTPLTRFTGVTSVRVDAGAETDNVKLENVTAPATVSGGAGIDKLQYLAERAGGVSVTLDGGDGGDEIEVDLKLPAQAGRVNASVAIVGGEGDDKARIQVTSDAADLVLSTVYNDAMGNDEAFFQLDQKPQTAGSRVDATVALNMGPGLDKALSKVESESVDTAFRLTGGGTGPKEFSSEVLIEGAAATARVAYDLTTGDDTDKIDLKAISQASTSLSHSQTIRTGGGNDLVKIGVDQIRPASVTLSSNIDLGAGNDEMEMGFAGDLSTLALGGLITGNAGDDKILVNVKARSLVNTLDLRGGGGNDLVDLIVA